MSNKLPENTFLTRRSDSLLRVDDARVRRRADRILLTALGLEWLAACVVAAWPWLLLRMAAFTSGGAHPTAAAPAGGWTPLGLGAGVGWLLFLLPLALNWRRCFESANRFVLTVAQLGFCALFAWLASGRWSTLEPAFLSIALLAFYRDCRVLTLALFGAALEIYFFSQVWPALAAGTVTRTLAATAGRVPSAGDVKPATWDLLRSLGWLALTTGFFAVQSLLARREQRAATLRQARSEVENTLAAPAVPVSAAAAVGAQTRELQTRLAQAHKTGEELRTACDRLDAELRSRTQELQRAHLDLERQVARAQETQTARKVESQRWKILNDNLPHLIWTSQPDGQLDYFNARWQEFTGFSSEQGQGDGWKAVVHPEDLPALSAQWNEALAAGTPFAAEHRLRCADGTYRWQLWQALPIANEAGTILQWAGTCTDIDDAKNSEHELRLNEERFRTLVRAGTQIMWLGNARGRVTTDMPSWRAATGQTVEQILGYGWLDALHPDDRPTVEQTWQENVGTGRPFEMFSRAQTPDGGWRYYHMRAAPIFDADGTLREWIGAAADITERQLAKEALQQAHDYLEERVAERTAQLSEANEALQLQVAERKQIEAELAEARDAAVRSARLKSQFLANMSHEIRTPMNGVVGMTSLLLATPLNAEQHDCVEIIRQSGDALLTIINDILDFSKIEAGRLSFDEADFELRATVRSVIDLLAENAQAKRIDLNFQVLDHVPASLRGDAGRLRQVLLNLLSNAVKFTPEGGRVFLKVLCQRETEHDAALTFEISDTGIGMDQEILATLFRPFTQADGSMTRRYGGTGLGLAISKQLVEMMRGEISVESQPDQGSVFRFTVQLPKALGSTEASRPDAQPLTAVSSPQPEPTQPEPAQTAQPPRPASLPPAKITTPILASRIKLRTDPRVVITHRLPAQRPLVLSTGAASSAKLTATVIAPVPPVRVLVVEDNSVSQKVITKLLSKLGCTADVVVNGQEALAACARTAYDVVFMDCQMPGMDGLTATRHLRAQQAASPRAGSTARRTAVIALTANALAGDRERCLAAGMDDYLTKPIKAEELAAALAKWAPCKPALQSAA
ncbi:MAG: PAS domain-containing protein [Verrucomicrobia bacterium]|nr:PAS domain-containing protein [Verrucomicrobiota bacterium]